jgi:ribosomal protein L18E
MPLSQRLPKLRGFHNFNRREFTEVNLGKLNRFPAGTEVSPELLLETGVVRKILDGVKVLGAGELKVALTVSAHRFSSGARAAIEKAGGTIVLLEPEREDGAEPGAVGTAATGTAGAEPAAAGPAAIESAAAEPAATETTARTAATETADAGAEEAPGAEE